MNPTLKPSQRAAIEDDLAQINDSLTNPDIAPYIQNKQAMQRQAQQMKKALEEQAPQPYTSPMEKDAAMREERELRERWSDPSVFPSKEEMHRNRDGSVYKHLQWDKEFKPDVLRWKEIKKRLNPDSDDPNLTNIELYRRSRPFEIDTTAQIKMQHGMSPQAKENWPEEMAEPKAKTAVSHFGDQVKEVFAKLKREPAPEEKEGDAHV